MNRCACVRGCGLEWVGGGVDLYEVQVMFSWYG